jgi:hypothetical protein
MRTIAFGGLAIVAAAALEAPLALGLFPKVRRLLRHNASGYAISFGWESEFAFPTHIVYGRGTKVSRCSKLTGNGRKP